jgi:hypothetical protein
MSDSEAPAPGTKADLEQRLAAAQAENENLRGQLVAATGLATAGRTYQPAQTFFLSEGDRQELERHGVANIGGRLMTVDQVRAELAKSDTQSGVEIGDPKPGTDRREIAKAALSQPANIRGVTYVYPSVADGLIDPAVAGTPGITGPAGKRSDVPPADVESE